MIEKINEPEEAGGRWISAKNPNVIKNESFLNRSIPLAMFLIMSILPLKMFFWGYRNLAIFSEIFLLIFSVSLWVFMNRDSRRGTKEIKLNTHGIHVRKENGREEFVRWGDIKALYRIGPNEKGLEVYFVVYNRKSSLLFQNLRSPYSEDGFLVSPSILNEFYSRWTDYYSSGGKYYWLAEEEQAIGNYKKLIPIGLAIFTGNLLLMLFLLLHDSQTPVILVFTISFLLVGGFVLCLLGLLFHSSQKNLYSKLLKMQDGPENYFPHNVKDFLESHSITK